MRSRKDLIEVLPKWQTLFWTFCMHSQILLILSIKKKTLGVDVIILILQKKKSKHKETKQFSHCHSASGWGPGFDSLCLSQSPPVPTQLLSFYTVLGYIQDGDSVIIL
jgi:hypothetical protein